MQVGRVEAQEIRVDVGSLSLGCLEYGDDAKPPVVVFHGMADSAWAMDSLAQALAVDHHVFSFDLRGHGRSDWGAYTLAHFVGDIRGAIATLDLEKPIVVGHSLGGQSASQFCGAYPEIPKALVLIEALGPPRNPRATKEPDAFYRESFRNLTEMVRQRAHTKPMGSLDEAIARFTRAHPLLDPERAALIVEKATKETIDGGREWRFDPSTRDWLAGHDHDRAEQRWRGVRCPTLVIQGKDSWERFWKTRMTTSPELVGAMADEELHRRLSNFAVDPLECVEIEGAGHMVHYDTPDRLHDAVIEFLHRIR